MNIADPVQLGEAAGPLLLAPLSEIFGRYPVMNAANIAFTLITLLASFASSTSMIIVMRFLTGLSVSTNVLNPAIVSHACKTVDDVLTQVAG